MNLFKFLYFTTYSFFYKYSQKRELVPKATSKLLSLLLSTNTLMLFFFIRYTEGKNLFRIYPYNYFLKIIMLLIFVMWYFICDHYFIKKGKYEKIIEYYMNKYPENNFGIIGILYIIGTLVSFIGLQFIKH